MVIASCMEFAGAMAVGAQVTETIRTKVISTKLFESDPSVLMLGMVCAIVGSSVWLTIATRFTMPVSTTHSIMGGVIGVGIAAIGAEGVNWSWNGVSQVFAAWAIAPGISGIFASIIFLATKYGVMRRKNPVKMAFIAVPFYFFLTSALLTMLIVWKGGSARIDLEDRELPGPILGVGAGVALIITVFFIPYLYRKILKDDWQLKGWQVIQGPLLLRRPDPPARPEGVQEGGIRDYYEGHLTRDELDARRAAAGHSNDVERHPVGGDTEKASTSSDIVPAPRADESSTLKDKPVDPKLAAPPGPWYSPAVAFFWAKYWFWHGVDQEVVAAQGKKDFLSGDIEAIHATGEHFNNEGRICTSDHLFETYADLVQRSTPTHSSKFLPPPLPPSHMAPTMSPTPLVPTPQSTSSGNRVRSAPRCLFQPGFSLSVVQVSSSASGRTVTTSCAHSVIRLLCIRRRVASRWNWAPPLQ